MITGASSGIGRATALHLAESGYKVLASSRSLRRLSSLSDEALYRGFPLEIIEININEDQSVKDAVSEMFSRFQKIDVLINNAGYGLWGPVGELSINEIKRQFETNFFAAVRMINAVLPSMIERRSGSIINVSSVLGRLGIPFNGAYTSSKFALEGISESIRTEVKPFGVRVSLVEPGWFQTNFQNNMMSSQRTELGVSQYSDYIARYQKNYGRFKRRGGDPARVAKLIHKIISSRNPRFRYVIGADARLGIAGMKFLPQRIYWALLDWAIMK